MSEETPKTVDQPPEPQAEPDESTNDVGENRTEKIAVEVLKALIFSGLLVFLYYSFRPPFVGMLIIYAFFRCFKKGRSFAIYTFGFLAVLMVVALEVVSHIEKDYLLQGDAIITKIEEYKTRHGSYPETLSDVQRELNIDATFLKKFNYSKKKEGTSYNAFITSTRFRWYMFRPGEKPTWKFWDLRFPPG